MAYFVLFDAQRLPSVWRHYNPFHAIWTVIAALPFEPRHRELQDYNSANNRLADAHRHVRALDLRFVYWLLF